MAYDPALIEQFANKFGVSTIDGAPAGGGSAADAEALRIAKAAYPDSPQKWPGYVPPPAPPPVVPPPPPAAPPDGDAALQTAAKAYPNNPEKWNEAAAAIRGAPAAAPLAPQGGALDAADLVGAATGKKPEDVRGGARLAAPAAAQAVPQELAIAPQFRPAGWGSLPFYRPGHLQAQREAEQNVVTGQQEEMGIQRAAQDKAAEELRAQANYLRDQNRADMLAEQERQKRYTEVRSRAAKLADEASDLKIQPGRIFADAGAASGIVMAIGGALGGFLQARQGGPNQFLQTVDKIIDRDIAAQQTDIEQKWRKADAARNSMSDLRSQLGDERLAEEVQRQRVDKWVSAKIGAIAAQSNSDVIKQRAKELQDTLNLRWAERDLELDKLSWRPAQMIGGTGKPAKDLNTVTLPNGKTYSFQTEADRTKVQERLLAQQDLGNTLQRVKVLRAEVKKLNPVTSPIEYYKKLSELDSLAESALPSWSTSRGQGQVKEGETERYKKNLFPFSSIANPAADRIIDRQVEENEANLDSIVRTHNGEEVTTGYRATANGIEPTASYVGKRIEPKPKAMPGSFKAVGSK